MQASQALSQPHHHRSIQEHHDKRSSICSTSRESYAGISLHSGRVTTCTRPIGTNQPVQDAAIYIIHLPLPVPATSQKLYRQMIATELSAHFRIVRVNRGAVLYLVANVSLETETGQSDTDAERKARLHNLYLYQMARRDFIKLTDLTDILESIRDHQGQLKLIRKFRTSCSSTSVLEVRYTMLHRRQSPDLSSSRAERFVSST